MDKQIEEEIKKVLEEFLEKMDISGSVEVVQSENDFLLAKIQSDEAGLLIGQNGSNLEAIQFLARAIFNKSHKNTYIDFAIDVNCYRENRLELLQNMAVSFAREVVEQKYPKILEPMPPHERRAIHLVLKNFKGVQTESQGEGFERRIIIKPTTEIS